MTVQAVLAARIDWLPSATKHVLHMAAVIGMEVPVPLVQAIAELPEATVHDGLGQLQAAEFLYDARLFPERAYTFKHALTREVAYSSLPLERRRTLHAQIVEAIETLADDRRDEQVERLAQHAMRGQVWSKALLYCRQAGAKAFAASAYREAVGCWEQALEALQHLPPDRPTLEQAVDLHHDLSLALQPLAQLEQMLMHLRAAERLAEGLEEQRRLGHVYRRITSTLRQMQDLEPALAYGQRTHTIATALGDVGLQIWVNYDMAQIYWELGDYRLGVTQVQQMLTSLQGERRYQSFGGVVLPSVQARTIMARCLSELGEFANGVAYADESLQIAEAVNRPHEHILVYSRVGYLHMR